MPLVTHAASTDDDKIEYGEFENAPFSSAGERQFGEGTTDTGDKGAQSRYSAIPTDSNSQRHHTTTRSAAKQLSIDRNLGYKQEAMPEYQQGATELLNWPANAPTGSSAPLYPPSHSNTSKQPATHSRQHPLRSTRDDQGSNGVGIDYAPLYPGGEGGEGGESVAPGLASDMLSCLGDFCSDFGKCCNDCFHDSKGNFEIPCCLPGDC
jgi:hypothetical protein